MRELFYGELYASRFAGNYAQTILRETTREPCCRANVADTSERGTPAGITGKYPEPSRCWERAARS